MKPNKVSITIISIPDCPPCDKLKIIIDDLLANNKFLKKYVSGVQVHNDHRDLLNLFHNPFAFEIALP